MTLFHDWRDGFNSQKEEFDLHNLPVDGHLPGWISGAYISTGPGDFDIAGKYAKHWFDGYAMLKGFYIQNGKVSFKNKFLLSDTYLMDHFIEQSELKLPKAYQQITYIKQRFKELQNSDYQYDNGNVTVCAIGKQAIAMTEVPSKVAFDINTLETKGHMRLDSDFIPHSELAHTLFDSSLQKWVNIAYIFGETTKYIIYYFDSDTNKKKVIAEYQSDIPFYMHSFSITENYFILFQTPLIFDFSNPDADFSEMIQYADHCPSQFIIIDRKTQISKIIPTSSFICFHQVNAYEDKDKEKLVIDLCCYQSKIGYDNLCFENIMKKKKDAPTYLTRFYIDLDNEQADEHQISHLNCEFPRIHFAKYAGRSYIYAYLAHIGEKEGKSEWFDGVLKINVNNGHALSWKESGCYCGEPIFVPNPQGIDEDDGVVLSMVFDAGKNHSFLLVLNATDFQVLAKAYLPTFMPYGLHGDWLEQI